MKYKIWKTNDRQDQKCTFEIEEEKLSKMQS